MGAASAFSLAARRGGLKPQKGNYDEKHRFPSPQGGGGLKQQRDALLTNLCFPSPQSEGGFR